MSFERAAYGSAFPKFFEGLTIKKHAYKAGEKPPGYEGADITSYTCPMPMQLGGRNTGFEELWEYFLELYVRWLQDPATAHGTFVIDTLTSLTRVSRDAYLQELQTKNPAQDRQQLQQIEYGRPDEKIRAVLRNAKAMQRNLVVVHHLRPEYGQVQRDGKVVTGPIPGAFEHDGIGNVMQLVDVRLRQEKKDAQLTSKFLKCGPKLDLESMPALGGMTWDFMIGLIESGWYGPAYDRREAKKEEVTE